MAKKNFTKATSKKNEEIQKKITKGVKDANLGNAVIDHLANQAIEAVKSRVNTIAGKTQDRIIALEKECEKAANAKPDNDLYSEEGVVAPFYTKEAYKKKQEPFEKLEVLTKAFDAACISGEPEDFYKLEKLLK
jgi:hypothetical protein